MFVDFVAELVFVREVIVVWISMSVHQQLQLVTGNMAVQASGGERAASIARILDSCRACQRVHAIGVTVGRL
jgi:hypothetical protein